MKKQRFFQCFHNQEYQKPEIALRTMAKTVRIRRGIDAICLGWVHEKRSSVVLAMAVVSLTGVMGHKLYNQPQLAVGTLAPETMKAPYTATIEDKEETEAQRQAASRSSTPVLMIDVQKTERINKNLQQLLDQGNQIRTVAGVFPFFDTTVLSIPTQHYLRSCSETEWKTLLINLEDNSQQKSGVLVGKHKSNLKNKQASTTYLPLLLSSTVSPLLEHRSLFTILNSGNIPLFTSPLAQKPVNISQNTEFTQAVAELKAYGATSSKPNLDSLIVQISQVRQAYTQAEIQLVRQDFANSKKVYTNTALLQLSDKEWGQAQKGIRQSAEKILAQGIPQGLPSSIIENAVKLTIQELVPKSTEALVTKLLLVVLEPNLKNDEEQTKRKIQQASDGVSPVMRQVQQGKLIVTKGKVITKWHFDVLEHYQLIRRENNWLELTKLASVVTVAIGIFVLVGRKMKCKLRQRDYLLVLLLTLSTPGMLTLRLPYTTWSAVGLLLGSFYAPALGVTVVGLLLLILPMTLEISVISLLAGGAAGILGSSMAQKLRSREELALLGVAIAITQGGVYLLINLFIGTAFGGGWYRVLQEAGLFALSGLGWSVVALGLSPYLEKVFDLVTPIRLAELANPNRPLLKRLATETPGTFQHTLLVATLAEAAAKKLGCNVELVRAGTLYHDIGKMHDPLGFIENQMGGPNKHETEIKDPWQSAAIIKKHVTEGLVMAQRHLLPTAIQAFIPEHQGTMLIAYFYHQALEMSLEDPNLTVDEGDFRYDGPIPQSRETGIVMLADSCEAALRSLKDATPEQALTMLKNILRAKWQDNQMVDSGLTREEMSQISQIFVEVWQQFHHKRIAYPKLKAGR
ncbi:HD family phosphohydrolase [Umezakia ovalisporum]|uniref:HD family phosphohydrolase n=1 Tax=Umezakia ovalisporum FSS-43 TaxID=2740520 RepID=A0ABT6K3W3_9CYAN|nr:HD family phosphohydrolase [Umezakia ovalisporum]MDH6057057.1 HD family phosphohydrolase [Umezakia ovalisporum FSS-43]MDH6070232.1 HD family phosphohydrolase [Umezakia ovalisporum CobakiLakeA]MDH6073870.1 HD family phosphohydrolase [Umezakia ovalisporum CS-1034]MDH6082307.1 HD family phosphohydrolase [Umezakia ovalisporum FSS-44]MDH6095572.1 HD family phosphohydrolase [Umezakia ovalisporum CobakiLakeB]